MPCPHCKITIIKRSENESAVSAAYQSGEKLFSEYDQEQKYYPYKNEVTHKEIMLPPPMREAAEKHTVFQRPLFPVGGLLQQKPMQNISA